MNCAICKRDIQDVGGVTYGMRGREFCEPCWKSKVEPKQRVRSKVTREDILDRQYAQLRSAREALRDVQREVRQAREELDSLHRQIGRAQAERDRRGPLSAIGYFVRRIAT